MARTHLRETPHVITTSEIRIATLRVQTFSEPAKPGKGCLDEVSASHREGFVRVSVTNPALSWPEDPRVAAHASGVTQAAIRAGRSVGEAYDDANAQLYSPYRGRGSNGSHVSAATVEIRATGLGLRAEAWRAGDCEVWYRHRDMWRPVFTTDVLLADARTRWERNAPDPADRAAHLAAYDTILGNIDDWSTTPLGMFRNAKVDSSLVAGGDAVDAIAVFTAGFGGGVPDFDDIRGFIEDLHAAGSHEGVATHHDYAVAMIYRDSD